MTIRHQATEPHHEFTPVRLGTNKGNIMSCPRISSCPPSSIPSRFVTALFVACLAALLWVPSIQAADGKIHWKRLSGAPCGSEIVISCGEIGQFVFSSTPFEPNPKAEAQSRHNPLNKASCRPPLVLSQGSSPLGMYASRSEGNQEALPCDQGSCLTEGALGADVLVVDWWNSHGWTVAGVIDQVLDQPADMKAEPLSVGLLDLEDPGFDLGYDGVGDPEVIAQLCKIAELPEPQLPITVNMSFGRKVTAARCVDEASLECEIDQILHHLRDDLGIVLVGAAGNHGNMLFPAASEAVLSAGSVEIASLRHRGEIKPAAQTPERSNVLVPGYGLFLRVGASIWSAPPGSSYAAALATGWLTHSIVESFEAWTRLRSADGDTRIYPARMLPAPFYLEIDGTTLAGSTSLAADELIRTSLGWRPETCPVLDYRSLHQLEVTLLAPDLPDVTFDDLQSLASHPCPESRPCVPCHDLPGDPDGNPIMSGTTKAVGIGASDNADQPSPPDPPLSPPIRIDLRESHGIDTKAYDLLGIYLQVGSNTYSFSDSTNASLLGELELGKISALEITNLPVGFSTQQAHLVFLLSVNIADSEVLGHQFTISIPIANHNH